MQKHNSKPIISLKTIQHLAQDAGFDACGVSIACVLIEEQERLAIWLAKEMHGEMGYMERNVEKRIDPTILVEGAKSVISVLAYYNPGSPGVSVVPPKISRFALSANYHVVVKEMLFKLLELLRIEFGNVSGRAFVDSAPVLERTWAEKAGLGWIGKNGLLINQKLGSYVFIGELIVDLEIEPSIELAPNRCGTCTKCIDACPTGAIVSPKVVDARKCISYLTIEKKSSLTGEEKSMLNGWCFGCDICQEVCPWNAKKNETTSVKIKPYSKILSMLPYEIKNLNEVEFDSLFCNSTIYRSGFLKVKENISSLENLRL